MLAVRYSGHCGKPLEQVDVSGLDRVFDVSNVCVTCDAAC